MLRAHLLRICRHFIITALERSGMFLDYLSLTLLCAALPESYSYNHPLFCSFRVRQLFDFCLQESLYLSMWQSNFPQTGEGMWKKKTISPQKMEKKDIIVSMTALIIHYRATVSKCLLFVCFVYFTVSRSGARLLLRMKREMTTSGRDNSVYTNSKKGVWWMTENKNDLLMHHLWRK